MADECWVTLALLTRENPDRFSFTSREILERIRREKIHREFRQGLHAHIHQHNVANCRPSTGRYRMFYRLNDGTFRLYRPGDAADPDRSGKFRPAQETLPLKYHPLLQWYEQEYCGNCLLKKDEDDPILSLRGLGKELWEGVEPDAWVGELRAGWGSESSPRETGTTASRREASRRVASESRSHGR